MKRKSGMTLEESIGWGVTACVVAMLGLLLPIPSFVELYGTAPQTAIRPMGHATAIMLAGIGSPLVVLPCAFQASRCAGLGRRLAAVATVASLATLPLYASLFHWIVAMHELILKP